MSDFQEAYKTYKTMYGGTNYIYLCSRCNKEIKGYLKCKVKGKVFCSECKKENVKEYNSKCKMLEKENTVKEFAKFLMDKGIVNGSDMPDLVVDFLRQEE